MLLCLAFGNTLSLSSDLGPSTHSPFPYIAAAAATIISIMSATSPPPSPPPPPSTTPPPPSVTSPLTLPQHYQQAT